MSSYFGWPNDGSDPSGGGDNSGNPGYAFVYNFATAYTCPGSGDQNIDVIQTWMKKVSTGAGYVRLAIYTVASPGLLVCQGNAKVGVTNATYAWLGHSAFSGTTVLSGGSTYRISCVSESTDTCNYERAAAAGTEHYEGATTYYDDGFPANDSAATGTRAYEKSMRCGVTAAGGVPRARYKKYYDYRRAQ